MLLRLNVLFLGLSSLVVIDAAPVKLHEATSKLIETNYNQGLRSGANNRLTGQAQRESFPSYNGINKIPITLDDYMDVLPVPHPISSSKKNAFSLKNEDRTEVEESDSQGIGAVSKKGYYVILPPLHGNFSAPVVQRVLTPVRVSHHAVATPYFGYPNASVAAPLPARIATHAHASIRIAAAPVHVVPHAFETRGETRVVVGHTSWIIKPNLGAGRAHVTNFDYMGLAQTKNAAPESIVQKSKVLAPARNVSEITPQVTVQHPTKVIAAPAIPI